MHPQTPSQLFRLVKDPLLAHLLYLALHMLNRFPELSGRYNASRYNQCLYSRLGLAGLLGQEARLG